MNSESVIVSKQDDVVFENRNKDYGAYKIRQSYQSNLSKSSGLTSLFLLVLFAGIQVAMMLRPEPPIVGPKPPDGPGIIPPPIIITDPKPPVAPPMKQVAVADLPPRVVTTDEHNDPPVDEHQNTSTNTGDANGGDVDTGPSTFTGPGVEPVPPVIEPPKTVDFAEVMPEFEGGMKALYKYLRKNLRYPPASRQTGDEGTVFIRFVVGANGEITGVEVLKSISGLLDKEAARVITKMPKWKPGSQHGNPINVRMVLPIKFELER